MPTDGTLLLEHMPRGKQYLVTALSVFFSFGSVLSAIVGIIVIPGYSCPARKEGDPPCDVASMNKGWQYLLMAVGLIVRVFLKLFSQPYLMYIMIDIVLLYCPYPVLPSP